jgi:hypothetical protein
LKYGFNGITPCTGDFVCNANGTCVAPQCHATADCNDPTMICDIYGECVPSGDGSGSASQYTLSVQIAGSGTGTVTSAPPGISCSSGTCSGVFDAGTDVTLSQVTSAGSFLGWASACKGTDACSVTLSSDQKVGAMFGTKGEVLWTKPIEADGANWGHGVVTTADGDVVAVGQFAGTMTLDAFTLQTGGTSISNAYIAKFDGLTGKTLWAKSLPVVDAMNIATDGDAFYLIGVFAGTTQIGASVLTSLGGDDTFVAKLNASGEAQWGASAGGAGTEHPSSVTVANGIVALTGYETAGITIGMTSYPASGASADGFVAAFDASTGAVKWSRDFTATGVESGAEATTADSALLVGGHFSGPIDFGGGSVSPYGSDAFVARYDLQTGALTKLDHWGSAGSNADVTALAKDATGNTVAAGPFGGTLTINGTTYTATGNDVFVVNYGGTTNKWMEWWSTSSGAIAYPTGIAIGIDDIVIGGNFCKGTIYIGTTTLTGVTCTVQNNLRTGMFVRMRNDGTTFLGVHTLGTYGWTDAVARAPDARAFATGKFNSALRLDTQVLIASGQEGAYVLAVAPQ